MPPPLFILQNPARPRPWGALLVMGALQDGDKNKMASFCCKHIIQANERLIKDPLESKSDELLGFAQLETGGCGASKRTEYLLTLISLINVEARLLILKKKSPLHVYWFLDLFHHSSFISKTSQPPRLFQPPRSFILHFYTPSTFIPTSTVIREMRWVDAK